MNILEKVVKDLEKDNDFFKRNFEFNNFKVKEKDIRASLNNRSIVIELQKISKFELDIFEQIELIFTIEDYGRISFSYNIKSVEFNLFNKKDYEFSREYIRRYINLFSFNVYLMINLINSKLKEDKNL